jgi:hypothetical protein
MDTMLWEEGGSAIGLEVRPTRTYNGAEEMELINRQRQREMLEALGSAYPEAIFGDGLDVLGPYNEVSANLAYLAEHGLVRTEVQTLLSGRQLLAASITAAGIDFLADDGGLTAVLGVVTVKFHEDAIKALLLHRIEEAPGDPTVKSALSSQITALPAEGLKHLTTKALDAGLQQMPNALQWLQTALSSSG